MHKRLEDLGRIREKLEQLVLRDVFDPALFGAPKRHKDLPEWIDSLSSEEVYVYISKYYEQIENISDELYEILSIARGDDDRCDA